MLIEFQPGGVVCPAAGVAVDPVRGAEYAIITHAHSDHARRGSRRYLAHPLTAAVLRKRLGPRADISTVEYGEGIHRNGVRISLHPSGHLPGAAQVRLEHRGGVAVVSGDYKLRADGLAEPFEPVRCHHFVTESTFGLPIFRFPPQDAVADRIHTWWKRNAADGIVSVLQAWPLGKAQRLATMLDRSIGAVQLDPAVHAMHETLRTAGVRLPDLPVLRPGETPVPGSLIISSRPAAAATPGLTQPPVAAAFVSGWMLLRAWRGRSAGAEGFVLSDHADWEQLNAAVAATRAERVSVVHGYAESFARWLREHGGVEADAPVR